MRREWTNAVDHLRQAIVATYPDVAVGASPGDFDGTDEYLQEFEHDPPRTLRFDREQLRPPLFDYQQDIVDHIIAFSDPCALLALPTGAGKTRTAVSAIVGGIAEGSLRHIVWLAPSVELLDQAFETFLDIARYQGNLRTLALTRDPLLSSPDPTILLTTPQTIYARRNDWRYKTSWDLVVFDEAHQLGAPTFIAAIESLGVDVADRGSGSAKPQLLGLSATPGRVDLSETEDLVSLFRGVLIKSPRLGSDPVGSLQKQGVLASLHFKQLTGSQIAFTDEPRRLVIAANACAELTRRGGRTLVFASSVPSAIFLDELLKSRGLHSAALHSEISPPRRKAIVDAFAFGKIDVLVNRHLLATGYDCPAVTDVLILGKVNSPILFEQMVGRAARGPKTGGSRNATVWDFDDHLKLHGRPTSYYRYRDFDWS